jgi:5-methylcytosine-specific restriction endonuclease McrA
MRAAMGRFWVIKGHAGEIRRQLYQRDSLFGKLFCAACGKHVEYWNWDADHIVEVRHGGGGRDLSNYQVLCKKCHRHKTKRNFKNQ